MPYCKQLVILTLDKKWDPQKKDIRARKNDSHDYYKGTPFKVSGVLIENGKIKDTKIVAEN
ncbi:MAG: hypothetical protein NVS3B14_06670 [Ktedonobacteraceae bacterium]